MGAPSAQSILNLIRLPARLSVEQVAVLLNFTVLEVSILMKTKPRLLKPLGDPPANGHKFFATEEIVKLAADPAWLDKASKAVIGHWRTKNQQRQSLVTVG